MTEKENSELTTGETGKATDIDAALEQAKSKEIPRTEVSGTAIARMMGVATTTELKLLEGKLDLISGRINTLMVRTEKITSQFAQLPTGSDLERIDVQIGSLKTTIRDLTVLISSGGASTTNKAKKPTSETQIVTPDDGKVSESETA